MSGAEGGARGAESASSIAGDSQFDRVAGEVTFRGEGASASSARSAEIGDGDAASVGSAVREPIDAGLALGASGADGFLVGDAQVGGGAPATAAAASGGGGSQREAPGRAVREGGVARGVSPGTAALLAVLAVVFVGQLVTSWFGADGLGVEALALALPRADLVLLGALSAGHVWLEDEWFRVGAGMVLHASVLHWALNSASLWSVGDALERYWGPGRTVACFVLAGLFGNLCSLAWAEAPLIVGASGGVFGVAAALALVSYWGPPAASRRLVRGVDAVVGGRAERATEGGSEGDRLGAGLGAASGRGPLLVDREGARRLFRSIAIWLGIGLALPLVFGGGVFANGAHLGGVVAGLLVAIAFEARARWLGAAVAVGGLLLVGAGAWFAAHPVRPVQAAILRGYALEERGDDAGALREFRVVLAAAPADAEWQNTVAYTAAQAGVALELAESLARSAYASEPKSGAIADTLGFVLCRRGQFEEGRELLWRGLELGLDPIVSLQHWVECERVAIELPH